MARMGTNTLVIMNPTAGGGGVGRKRELVETLVRKFFNDTRIMVTDGPGRAAEYARQALETGVGMVVCVGGDGTLNEVVNGLFARPADKKRRPKLAYLPLGTGSDLAKSLGISINIENALRNISNGDGKWVDVGRASFIGSDGQTATRYFINVLSVGLGGEVVGRVNRSSKALGGFLTCLWATLAALFSFRKPLIRLRIDDRVDRQARCWHLAVANGQYQGGGMRIAPDARLDDGRFKVTVVGDLSLVEVFWNLPRLYSGDIYAVGKISGFPGRIIEVESNERVLVDIDGEQVGTLPLRTEILPLSLWICC